MNESCHTHQGWKSTFKVCHELEESSQTHTSMSHVTHTWYATSIYSGLPLMCVTNPSHVTHTRYGRLPLSVSRTREVVIYTTESCHAYQIWTSTFQVCHELEEFSYMNKSCHAYQIWNFTFQVCHELEELSCMNESCHAFQIRKSTCRSRTCIRSYRHFQV